jgi:putative salt-induced outer membrane protein YdiY
MRLPFRTAAVTAAAIALLLAAGSPSSAAVIPGWYASTDLSLVLNNGNSDTYNVGVTTDITRMWLRTSWKTTGSFVRNAVREPERQAVLSGTSVSVEKGPRKTKSEKIFVNSIFERRITERFFWNVGGTAERDIFAGLNNRLTGVVGVGYLWSKADQTATFKASIGGTYTSQDEAIDDPETENQFAGARFTASGDKKFGDRNQHAFTSELIVDENIQQTEDLRANWQNSLTANISQKLALKVGVQLRFDNLPELIEFPVFVRGSDGNLREPDPRPAPFIAPAKKLDVAATVSLVISISPGGSGARPTP